MGSESERVTVRLRASEVQLLDELVERLQAQRFTRWKPPRGGKRRWDWNRGAVLRAALAELDRQTRVIAASDE